MDVINVASSAEMEGADAEWSAHTASALYDLPDQSTRDLYWRALTASRIHKKVQYRIKRTVDVAAASFLITLLLPLFILIAVTIKLTSRGPILYKQQRLRQNARQFTLLKFRTMVDGADRMLDKVFHLNEASGPLFKLRNDPRVTPVGRILRASFLDELPQLINVIHGDMSLVGPRPCLASEAEAREQQVVFRFAVPQGITGPWQTHGHHRLSFEEQLRVERKYVETWCLQSDFQILMKTIGLVLRRRGI